MTTKAVKTNWQGEALLDDRAAEEERLAREAFLEERLEWERSLAGQRSMWWTEWVYFGLVVLALLASLALDVLVIVVAFGGG